jgi:hypothetical protein
VGISALSQPALRTNLTHALAGFANDILVLLRKCGLSSRKIRSSGQDQGARPLRGVLRSGQAEHFVLYAEVPSVQLTISQLWRLP